MGQREQEGLPYRTQLDATTRPAPTPPNEEEYSTLKQVRAILEEAVTGLYKDFNAFDAGKGKPLTESALDLLRQVEVKQDVYAIIAPLLDQVADAMQLVDAKYKNKR